MEKEKYLTLIDVLRSIGAELNEVEIYDIMNILSSAASRIDIQKMEEEKARCI